MTLSIKQLAPTFAGEVTGVDCRERLSADEVTAIHAGMAEFAVLVFRDQPLTDDEQLRFTLYLGDLEETRGGTSGNIHFRTDREVRNLGVGIKDFSNVGPDGAPLSSNGRAYAFKLADQLWHSDSSFNAIPASYSLLSSRSVVSWGGNTEFADMRAAYDALDGETKVEIEDLVCEHSLIYSREAIGFFDLTSEERDYFQPVRHRLVRDDARTGRKSLFLSAHAGAIVGWTIPEARVFLRDLTEHATQPRFVYRHVWRAGDLLMWDNRTTMHRARRFDRNEVRDVRRTTLAGAAE